MYQVTFENPKTGGMEVRGYYASFKDAKKQISLIKEISAPYIRIAPVKYVDTYMDVYLLDYDKMWYTYTLQENGRYTYERF